MPKSTRRATTTPAAAAHPFAHTIKVLQTSQAREFVMYSLPELAKSHPEVRRLPHSLRIVLESLMRNCDGHRITPAHVQALAQWQAKAARTQELPFVVARVILQDFTGVPLLADLAAMRNVAAQLGKDVARIEPLVPVDLVVDHSVMIDNYGSQQALDLNMRLEFQRNAQRYAFLKWGMDAFKTFGVVPPGFGIVHQVNLEYLARGVHRQRMHDGRTLVYPDSLVGTDSHTTMINGIGVVGWGVGGIEAEAAMLGQPTYLLTPDVVGVELKGQLRQGVTATDLVLTITELLRKEKVVGQFVEFFGAGVAALSVPDRATLANMAPEYGATMGFFPVDEQTIAYFKGTGRKRSEIEAFEAYFRAQEMFGTPNAGEVDYSRVVTLDLASVAPSLAGPKRPQDRIEIGALSQAFATSLTQAQDARGFQRPSSEDAQVWQTASGLGLRHGDILIAAITSCTNTSNPGVLLAAGLLAKKAVQAGLRVPAHIKTSLAPGSRVVTDYLERAGLLPYLQKLGFNVAAYGCTTCIGNAGDLHADINATLIEHGIVACSVLSGNRNFEARIHPNIKANFLASPPLVLAYALAGTVRKDLMHEPVGLGKRGKPIYLGDIWPSAQEIADLMPYAMNGKTYRKNYERVASNPGKLWKQIKGQHSQVYDWPKSDYIAQPPFFEDFQLQVQAPKLSVAGAHIMALLGDSVTTDHISPAGRIGADSPAGQYLQSLGVAVSDFNSYGARRGHHEVMMRGTFANVRLRNLMLPEQADGSRQEGGWTLMQLDGPEKGQRMSIYDAAMQYRRAQVPTVIFAGEEYGTGSSRDWAAKGTQLLGIRAVIARSFERIHRSNLVGMGVLPLQFLGDQSWSSLGLRGDERIDIDLGEALQPQSQVCMRVHRVDGTVQEVAVLLRVDTPIEAQYLANGGILPYVLRDLLSD